MDIIMKQPSQRMATLLPLGGTKDRPNIIIPYPKGGMDKAELQFLCEGVLAGRKLSDAEIVRVIEEAEKRYEERLGVRKAKLEIRRRLEGQVPHIKRRKHRWEDFDLGGL